jgi:hypothetical protein
MDRLGTGGATLDIRSLCTPYCEHVPVYMALDGMMDSSLARVIAVVSPCPVHHHLYGP